MNLEADEPSARQFLEESGGALEQDADAPTVYWATMHPRSAPEEHYYVRVAWDAYPHAAPSVKFADSVGGRLDVTRAWPVIAGYRAGSFDICKPFTKEGFNLHPEWRTGPEAWRTSGNPFLWVVSVLQLDLNKNYGGRAP